MEIGEKPGSSVRPRIVRNDVFVAAEAVVDRLGWDGLTMAALADELGVRSPSLYHHVGGLEAVRAELQARTMSELADAIVDATVLGKGAAAIRRPVEAQWHYAQTYPHRYDGFTRATINSELMAESSRRSNEAVGSILVEAGVHPDDVPELLLVLFISHHGFVALDLQHFYDGSIDQDLIFDRVIEGSIRTIEAAAARSRRAAAPSNT